MDHALAETPERTTPAHGVTLAEAFRVWFRVALLSFGGPAGQIAVMHKILVEEKRWISENRFLHALNYCMLLPGPEAQQLATYIGWLMHRTLGGIMAGGLFILPGIISILLLRTLRTITESQSPVLRGVSTSPEIDSILNGTTRSSRGSCRNRSSYCSKYPKHHLRRVWEDWLRCGAVLRTESSGACHRDRGRVSGPV